MRFLIGLVAMTAVGAQAQVAAPAFQVAQASDATLTCSGLAMEMSRAAGLMATSAQAAGAAPAVAAAPAAPQGDPTMAAYNQAVLQQNMGQLALQAQRAGMGSEAGAAIGALGLLGTAANARAAGQSMGEAASGVAMSQIASRVPGGAMVAGLMGGMFKKKPKVDAAAVQAAAAREQATAMLPLVQQRMGFLQGLMAQKAC